MKNFFKTILAALVCASSFAVVPAQAEQMSKYQCTGTEEENGDMGLWDLIIEATSEADARAQAIARVMQGQGPNEVVHVSWCRKLQ